MHTIITAFNAVMILIYALQGGPFTCAVFDPNGVQVSGLEGALPLVPHSIDVDCRDVGVPGEVHADIVHDKRSVHCRVERVDKSGFLYRVHFTPMDAGKHRVHFTTVFASTFSS